MKNSTIYIPNLDKTINYNPNSNVKDKKEYKEDFILKAIAGTVPAAETVHNSIGYFRMEGVPRFGSCDLSYWVQTLVPFSDAQNIEKEKREC